MEMNVHERTLGRLQQVEQQRKLLQETIKSIKSKQYRKVGLKQISLTDEDRKEMFKIATKTYNAECSKIYEILNQERRNEGLSELLNPFMKGK